MNRRVVSGLAVLGCVAAVSATTLATVGASTDDSRASTALAAGDNRLPTAEVVKYWADSKVALSPLLVYVRQLPKAIEGVQDDNGSAVKPQMNQAAVMAENFATARDLVGRIAVPATVPAGVGELLQIACQLYRQSALALTELKPAAPGPASLAIAQRAASLQAIGDRLFDQARRVLRVDAVGEGQAPVEYRYAPPVPAVADLTGAPAPALSGEQNLDEDLRSAAVLISGASSGKVDAPVTTFAALRNIASALEINTVDQGEDILGARLAIALALIAEGAKVDRQPGSADELLMLSNNLWNQSRTLSPEPHPALRQLDAPTRTRSQVWTGGEFNGRPPALAPGQDVGSGLSKGLPKVDPTEILKG
jgi:hypothetical protein